MLVKKTKTGKFAIQMSHDLRNVLFGALCNFLETESVEIMFCKFKTESDATRHLYYSVLNDLLCFKDYSLHHAINKKIIISRPEAIALIWLLRREKMPLLELKSSLHQMLS